MVKLFVKESLRTKKQDVKVRLLFFTDNSSDNDIKEEHIMNIGKAILSIRKEKKMSQEEFGRLFHVTRQTVSNWENEKSYPDLQTLVDMSNMFDISLDRLLKEDEQMVKSVSATFKDGIKWKKVKKIAVCILIGIGVLGITYTGIWHSSKNEAETKFNEGIKATGFSLIDEGYYVLNMKDNLKFILPNQKMPSLLDFSLDFHAKYLDAELNVEENVIGIRWLDKNNIWLDVKWDGRDVNRSSYRIDENGIFLKEEDGYKLEEPTQDIEALCQRHLNEIKEVVKEGTEIYQNVYLEN